MFSLARGCPYSFDRAINGPIKWYLITDLSVKIYTVDMNHPVVDMFGATATVKLGLVKNMCLFHDQAYSRFADTSQLSCDMGGSVMLERK